MRRPAGCRGRPIGLHYSGCVTARVDAPPASPPGPPVPAGGARWRAYAGAIGLCAAAAALAWPLARALDSASLVLIFLLAVVLAAARFGRGPALLAAGLSVLLFNLLFVAPRFSLAVADQRFVFTFGVMLAVGLLVGQLTAGLRAQARAAAEREQRVRSLYEISRELGGAIAPEQVAEAMQRFAAAQRLGTAWLWTRDRSDRMVAVGDAPDADLTAMARRAVDTGRPAGGTGDDGSAQASAPVLVLPLRATMAVRGALALRRAPGPPWSEDERRLLDTCATLLAGTLERLHYIDVARASAVEIEGERLRNSLLSAISHDLRTPLASLVGLADSLRLTRPPPSAQQAEIAGAMAASARRMSALANNLLDMARLESGAVRLNLQWQPLEEVVGTALAATADLLARRPVRVALADDLPLVRLDAVLMERVLVNLLENAAKYTPEGAPVDIDAARVGGEVELAVRDHGPGVPAGREADLFRKFERGRRESATPGVGLGLALCRAIVEAHGGRMQAENAAGGGARFVVRLPLGEPPPLPAGDGQAPEALA
jgi:two-component system, OmpR family, sensor histidine kinase KdpD